MWVFGYGSLMWDHWERQHDCTRRAAADLPGFYRAFNKASVRNWGTRDEPGPTLNLVRHDLGFCRGIAFEFPEVKRAEVFATLAEREGKGFPLHERTICLVSGEEVAAFVPLYAGKNLGVIYLTNAELGA